MHPHSQSFKLFMDLSGFILIFYWNYTSILLELYNLLELYTELYTIIHQLYTVSFGYLNNFTNFKIKEYL